MTKLSKAHKPALRWAVFEAAGWRGSLIGNPDTTAFYRFNKDIETACEALKALGIQPIRGTTYRG